LDGPLPKWCPAVALSRQDGHHSAVALLLKAALIQVSDYRLLGASGFLFVNFITSYGSFQLFCYIIRQWRKITLGFREFFLCKFDNVCYLIDIVMDTFYNKKNLRMRHM
jgi:hypothetical protein